MKSVDPGILEQSVCFTFQPSEFALKNMKYLTWCGHYYCTSRYFMERDTYPYNLLLYVKKGNMDVRYNNKSYLLKKGDVLLIDCVNPHYYRAHEGLEFYYIHFDGVTSHETTELLIQNNESPVFKTYNDISIGNELFQCVEFFKNGGITNIFQEAYQIERFNYLISKIMVERSVEISPVEKAILYIHENAYKNIKIDDIAKHINLSPSYIAHIFKKQTSYAPLEYAIKLRIEQAMMLLTHSNKSITQIADEVGYTSLVPFVNIFKRKTGFTPLNYRKMQLNEEVNHKYSQKQN